MQNVVATYIGVALYAILYAGYTLYERFVIPVSRRPPYHFVPLLQADLDTDAVWRKDEGVLIREKEREEKKLSEKQQEATDGVRYGVWRWVKRMGRHVY